MKQRNNNVFYCNAGVNYKVGPEQKSSAANPKLCKMFNCTKQQKENSQYGYGVNSSFN